MKKLLLTLITTGFAIHGWAQKVEVKDDKILVDGKEYAQIEKDGCGMLDVQCIYYVKTLEGKKILAVKQQEMKDPDNANNVDRTGRTLYLQYVFTSLNAKAETAFPTTLKLRPIDVARKVVKAGLLKEGQLDQEAANDFITTNGTPYSDRRKELSGPDVIIIEK